MLKDPFAHYLKLRTMIENRKINEKEKGKKTELDGGEVKCMRNDNVNIAFFVIMYFSLKR